MYTRIGVRLGESKRNADFLEVKNYPSSEAEVEEESGTSYGDKKKTQR